MPEPSHGPGVYVPPPFIFAAGWLVAWLVGRQVLFEIDGAGVSDVQLVAGLVLLAGGLSFMAWALFTFVRRRTPINPARPARLVVTDGPFQFTRNPMYLGLTIAYLGLAGVLNQAWPIVVLPAILVVLSVAVIEREERHLESTFGTEYEIYRNRVKRWF